MPEKQKQLRNWKNPKIIIAAISLSGLLTLWNTFASLDRQKDEDLEPVISTPSATPGSSTDIACLVPGFEKRTGVDCATVTKTRSS
jgi:hypothetical protein